MKPWLWLSSLLLASCTWLQDYGHCSCYVEAEDDCEVEVQFEWVRDRDERELETP